MTTFKDHTGAPAPTGGAACAAFANELINLDALLPAAIDWIGEHLDPGDVFDRDKLAAWANAAGYTLPPI